jgi:hypothetical protein
MLPLGGHAMAQIGEILIAVILGTIYGARAHAALYGGSDNGAIDGAGASADVDGGDNAGFVFGSGG